MNEIRDARYKFECVANYVEMKKKIKQIERYSKRLQKIIDLLKKDIEKQFCKYDGIVPGGRYSIMSYEYTKVYDCKVLTNFSDKNHNLFDFATMKQALHFMNSHNEIFISNNKHFYIFDNITEKVFKVYCSSTYEWFIKEK